MSSSAGFPLSELGASRRPLLLGSGADAALRSVEDARRWREEARLQAVARKVLYRLATSGKPSFSLVSYEDEDEPDNSPRRLRLLRALLERTPICVNQAGLDAEVERGSQLILCHGVGKQEFAFAPRAYASAIFFGDVALEADVSWGASGDPGEIHLCGKSAARVVATPRGPEEENYGILNVWASQRCRLTAGGEVSVLCRDRAVVHSRGERAQVHLKDQSRCVLGEAGSVYAVDGTTVVLGEAGRCGTIELDDHLHEHLPPARILAPSGEVLLAGLDFKQNGYEDREIRGIRVPRAIPF